MLVLVRYGEIFLKGNNRRYFENQLVRNIKIQTSANKVWKKRNRIFVDIDQKNLHLLSKVFGVISYSPAFECEANYGSVEKKLLELKSELPKKTIFRVTCKRSQKIWEPSKVIESKVGNFIYLNFGWDINLTKYDTNIVLEIIDKCYLYFKKYEGLGGLPSGVSGNVLVNIINKKDLLASLLMMKRGCRIYLKEGSSMKENLQKFSPFKVEEISSSEKSLKDKEIKAFVKSDQISDLNLEKEIVPTLRPLIGIDIERNLESYSI